MIRAGFKTAKVSTAPGKPAGVPGSASHEPYRDQIVALAGDYAFRIWQDIKEEYGFGYEYASVGGFVRRLRRPARSSRHASSPGKEGQVDYFRTTYSTPASGAGAALDTDDIPQPPAMKRWAQDRVHSSGLSNMLIDSGGVPEVVCHDNLKLPSSELPV
jgi:hypothetical protein